jgi:TetR/AcrR family transcriptional repressor of lmrAB and yxaGH operons
MATDTKRRIVAKAAELLHRGGYHATGIQQLTATGELPRGSLYFHFPGGKEELACAALDHAGDQLRAALEETFHAHSSVSAGLAAALEQLGARLEASGWHEGCPIATTTLEMAAASEPIRATCSRIFASWTRIIAERLIAEGVAPDRAEHLGTVALAAIEGALLLARAHRSTAPLDAIRRSLPGLVSP